MNIHSCACPPAAVPLRLRFRRLRPSSSASTSATLLIRAAIDTFAARGFFNAQVADVARAAGVAAGTVYLYFRSKDDLLISIFERTMTTAIAEGRQSIAGLSDPVDRLREIARLHLDRLGRDRALAVVFQVELRQSTKFMERFSSTQLRDYLGIIRDVIADGQAQQVFRPELNPTLAAKLFFGALDEMATNWILSRRRYSLAGRGRRHRRLLRRRAGTESAFVSAPIRSVAVLGAGTMGAQIAAHVANAGLPVLLLDVTADAARDGLARARALKPDPFFLPDGAALVRTGGFDNDLDAIAACDWIVEAIVEQPRRQAVAVRARRRDPRARTQSSAPTLPAFRSRPSSRAAPTASGRTRSAPTSSIRRGICGCSRSSRRPTTDPEVVERDHPRSPTIGSARAWSSRRTRPTSSPTTSACTA